MKMKSLFSYIILFLFCYGCSPYPKEVEQALKLAGNNQKELVKVLEHYRGKDKLKFEAACFLISNMPYHKSKIHLELSPNYFNYFKKVDSIYLADSAAIKNDSLKRVLAQIFDSIPPPLETPAQSDIEIINSVFLINTIEDAFVEWLHSPLLKNNSFDEFKEWVLPYRSVDESIVIDRKQLKSIIYDQISQHGMDNIYKPIDSYQKYIRLQRSMNAYIASNHHIDLFDPFIPAFKMDCHNLAARTCNFFRSCGIPVVYEFTPQWPDKDSRHYWCASPDSNNILQPYTPPYNNLRGDWDLSLKYAGKVFQRTFGAMKDSPYFLKNTEEIVPSVFDIATIKDVTSRYHQCQSLTLPFQNSASVNLAYLSFFNTQGEFTPVAWGRVDKHNQSVTFDQVPLNILFFPSYMSEEGNVVGFDTSFMLRMNRTTGQIIQERISCDTHQKIQMKLFRKYPPKKHLVDC